MMNSKTGFYILLAALSLTSLFSCLGGGDEIEYEVSTDAQLISFSLSSDSLSVLATAKFSIDQKENLIYNYDSLPFLTDTAKIASRAKVSFTTGSGVSASVRVEHLDGDTAWVATGDSLRFASPFKLKLYAPDGKTHKTYTVTINIHQIDPDSVQYHLATANDLPVVETPEWETLALCPDEVIACLGFLRPDEQKNLALVVKDDNGDLRFALSNDKDWVDYRSGEIIPKNFPLTGFAIFNDRSFAGRLTIISSLQSVWATDNGLYWTNLFGTQAKLPVIEGGNAFSYNGEIWFLNGKIVNGDYNSKTYFSRNGGVVWEEKPTKTQPPAAFPLRQDARVVVDADGKYFYIAGGQNQKGELNDVWKTALNSRLFDH